MGLTKAVAVGMDPAAKNDYCALAVVEVTRDPNRQGKDKTVSARVVGLRRVRGVRFEDFEPLLLETTLEADRNLLKGVTLGMVIDGTGIGQAPAESLDKALRRRSGAAGEFSRRVGFKAVTLTGGSKVAPMAGGQRYEVSGSRQKIIGDFVLAVNERRLDLTQLDTESLLILQREMKAFSRKTTTSGRERLEAKSGQHDDVIFALALAFWHASSMPAGGFMTGVAKAFGLVKSAPKPNAEPSRHEPISPTAASQVAKLANAYSQQVGKPSHTGGSGRLFRDADRIIAAGQADLAARERRSGGAGRRRTRKGDIVMPTRAQAETPSTDQRLQHGDDWWKFTPGGGSAI